MTNQPSESQLQAQIVEGLRALGYVVLEIGRYSRQVECPRCHVYHTPRAGYGNSRGAPDLLVSHHGFGPRWYGLEVKRPTVKTLLGTVRGGELRAEQRVLVEQGLVLVIHSLEDAVAVLEAC